MINKSIAIMLLPALLAVAAGYFWPQPAPEQNHWQQQTWSWPDSFAGRDTRIETEQLARFWPVIPAEEVLDTATTSGEPALVAIVRQGQQRVAQVLLPNGELQTLAMGDALGPQRSIIGIHATSVSWQGPEGGGELQLYPQPPEPSLISKQE